MQERVNQLLTERRQRVRLWFRAASLGVAVALHLVPVVALLLGPRLFAQPKVPFEFVDVQLVRAVSLPGPRQETGPQEVAAPVSEPPPQASPPPQAPALRQEKREKTPSRAAPASKPADSRAGASSPAATESGSSAAAGPGAAPGPAAVVGFDNPDFTYGYYVDRMLTVIRAHWTRPPLGGDVEMIVHFRIQSDGTVTELEIRKSSGYNSFDLAGRRAVQSASPLPPLPRSYRRRSLGVTLIIR